MARRIGIVATGTWVLAVLLSGVATAAGAPAGTPQVTQEISLRGHCDAPDSSRMVVTLDDQPRHEFAQRVYSYVIASDDAKDFDGAVSTNYAQVDTIDGKGTHHGYAVWRLPSGDRVNFRFEGTHVERSAGTENAPYSGEFTVTGGTGKYRDIRGHGRYEGHTTATCSEWTTRVAIQY
jgi:hypothetical protein